MKKTLVLLTLIFCSFLIADVSAKNLVSNGGFEQDLDDWKINPWYGVSSTVDIDTDVSKSGDQSVRLSVAGVNPVAYFCNGTQYTPHYAVSSIRSDKIIKLRPDEDYELSAWIKMDKDASPQEHHTNILIQLYKNETDWQGIPGAGCGRVLEEGRIISHREYYTDLEADEWEKKSIEFETNDENLYAKIWLTAIVTDRTNDTTVAWFDKIVLEREDDDDKRDRRKKPVVFERCEPNWECDDWSDCYGGVKIRQCSDINNCDYSYNKPKQSMWCETEQTISLTPEQTGKEKAFENNYLFWLLIGVAVLIVLIIVVLIVR